MANSAAPSSSLSQQRHHISHPEFIQNVIWNHRSLDSIRSTSSCLSGSLTGILGLTNFSGLGSYLISFTITNLIILIVNYFKLYLNRRGLSNLNQNKSKFDTLLSNLKFGYAFWFTGLIDNLFGFILWWTLFYGLIHIYD